MLVSYHRRKEAAENISRLLKHQQRGSQDDNVKIVEAADAEARSLKIEWEHGREGRIEIERDGRLKRVVVVGEDGKRRRDLELRISKAQRIERVPQMLTEGS